MKFQSPKFGVSGRSFGVSEFRLLVQSHEYRLERTDLADNVTIGDADDQSVLRRVVLVLGLSHKTLAGIVISLALF